MAPKKIKRTSPAELSVEWDDGHHGRHTMQLLRTTCPCASCNVERDAQNGLNPLPVITPGKFELRSIHVVGSYALQLSWADGHSTGIYSFEFLRQLCECEECARAHSAQSFAPGAHR